MVKLNSDFLTIINRFLIRFVSVSKKYPNKIAALDNLSLEIQEGEFVFLVGPSGSGKTTALRLLIREEEPTAGKIFFEDLDIASMSRSLVYELRRKLGVVFQDFKLLEDKSAYENVAFALEASGKSEKDIKETVPYVLEIVGLQDRMDAFPKELSGGEKQKIAIARALSNNPKVLIADEPTGNLDPAAAWDIVQVLNKINNWGTTVLMSTHGSEFVDSLSKRVIRLKDGKVLRDDMKGKYNPLEDFEAKIMVDNHTKTKKPKKEKNQPKAGPPLAEKKKEKGKKKKIDIKLTASSKPEMKSPESKKVKKKKKKTKLNSTKVANLELEKIIKDKLDKAGYKTLESIVDSGPDKIKKIKGIGQKEFEAILTALEKFQSNE